MKSLTSYITLLLIAIVTCLTSCVREDDEPALAKVAISRLYVSFSDYQLDAGQTPYNNIDIIDPADSLKHFKPSLSYNSGAKGGGSILFSPIAKYIFQSSVNEGGIVKDTSIQVMSINPITGVPGSNGLISNGLLTHVRGLAYHNNKGTENLYVADLGVDGVRPPSIYLFQRPGSYRGKAKRNQEISLGTLLPWTMAFKNTDDNSDLYVAVNGGKKGIAIFSNILRKNQPADTVLSETAFPPKAVLTIANQGEIRGFSYSARQDLLAVASYTQGSGAVKSVGRILLFERAGALLAASGDHPIEPTRIITGTLTGLEKPLDVAIDNRDGAKYLYVADADTKIVSRFLITDKDNVAPNEKKQYSLTPFALSLDARGPSEID